MNKRVKGHRWGSDIDSLMTHSHARTGPVSSERERDAWWHYDGGGGVGGILQQRWPITGLLMPVNDGSITGTPAESPH